MRLRAILLGLGAMLLATGLRADEPPPIRIGALAYRGAEEAEKAWAPTLAELQRALPNRRIELVAGSASFLTAAVAAHRLDFLITNPGHYLELEIAYSAEAIATEQTMDGSSASEAVAASVIVPSYSRDIFDLSDFKGRRLAAVSPEAFGYRAAMREFLDRGVDPTKDTELLFVGFPVEGVLKAILAGRADGGVVRSCLLEKLIAEGAIEVGTFRVVGRRSSGLGGCQISTRLYPGWAFVKVAQTPPVVASEVARVLLAMQPQGGDVVWTEPEDYTPVQDLYRKLRIGPYAPFSRLAISDFLWEQRWWGAFIFMAIVWWIVHAARVSHLLRKRTAELELAHEMARMRSERMEHTQRLSLMGEMASSLAHEINQPLAAILSYARGCERRLAAGADAEGVRAGVERIAVQAERAGSIVRRMRDFARNKPSHQEPVDLAEIVADALALFEPNAQGRGVRIDAEIAPDLPPVLADRLQIEEVLLNLLQNALEAIGERDGGVICVDLRPADHAVDLRVTDNGSGVPDEAATRIFEAFVTTKPDGLGLGLSLSRSIAEAHGGRLSVESALPGRTTFRLTLPLMDDARA